MRFNEMFRTLVGCYDLFKHSLNFLSRNNQKNQLNFLKVFKKIKLLL